MSAEQITVWVLIFLAVACAVWGICNMIPETDKDNSEKLPLLFRIFSPGIYFFAAEAGSLLESSFPKHSAELGEDLKKAALPMDVKDLYGASLCFAAAGGALGLMLGLSIHGGPAVRGFIVIAAFFIGLIYPRMYVQKIAEKRMDEIMHVLPFAIDLISSSMNAGLDFGAAVRYLISTGKEDVLKKEFGIFLRDVELGKTRTEALKDMQERISAVEFTRFVSAIAFGMDSGSSIIEIMRIQAEEMRRVKYARAEQQAAKAPVKMIVPMAIFVFPSMFIMIFIPIFLRIKDSGVLHMLGK